MATVTNTSTNAVNKNVIIPEVYARLVDEKITGKVVIAQAAYRKPAEIHIQLRFGQKQFFSPVYCRGDQIILGLTGEGAIQLIGNKIKCDKAAIMAGSCILQSRIS